MSICLSLLAGGWSTFSEFDVTFGCLGYVFIELVRSGGQDLLVVGGKIMCGFLLFSFANS